MLLIFCISAAFANNKTEIVLDWNCKSVNYEGQVIRLPDRSRVSAEIKINSDGTHSIKLKNNIFKEGIKAKVGGFLNGLFGKKAEPTHAVDYSECIDEFKKQFEQKITDARETICYVNGDNCPSTESITSTFSNKLNDQKIVKKSKELPNVPRYFTGHNESYINFNVAEKLNDYCVNNKEVSLEVLTSKQFIEQVANEVIKLNPVITDECLTKIEKKLKEHNNFDQCSSNQYPCNVINQARETYTDADLNFVKNKHTLISEKAKEEHEKKVAKEKAVLRKAGYRVDPEDGALEAVQEELDSLIASDDNKNNSNRCYNDYRIRVNGQYRSVFEYDSIIKDKIPYLQENLSTACMEDFLEDYMAHKYIKKDPLNDELCQTHDCELIKAQQKLFEENVNAMIINSYGEAAVQHSCENPVPFESSYKDIESILKDIKNVNQCSPLGVGETKVVNDYETTGVKMRYALKRNSANEMLANVVINFKDPDEGVTTTPEEMLERTKTCLEKASSYFTNAQGETIRVNVVSPEEAQDIPINERPSTNDVGIGDANMRSNSGKYAESVGCGTITHEVLHLMGLCDEYTETQRGYYVNTDTGEVVNKDDEEAKSDEAVEFVTAYNDCRAISESPSIMSSHWDAMNKHTGSKSICTCREGKESTCRKYLNGDGNKLMSFSIRNPFNFFNGYRETCKYKVISTSSTLTKASQLNDYSINPVRNIVSSNKVIIDVNSLNESDYGNSIGKIQKYRFTCECSPNDEKCQKDLKLIKTADVEDLYPTTSSCPYPNFTPKDGEKFSDLISKEDIDSSGFKLLGGLDIEVTSPPEVPGGSLLHPAHFSRIKYGSCKEKAQTYSMCAKYAYKALAKDCPDRPAVCDEEEKWLLSDQ